MEHVPIESPIFSAYQMKAADELTSGTYIEVGDLLVAKITPSFENDKQDIIERLPLPFGYATTEVIPINDIPGVSDKRFLASYLLRSGVRAVLAAKMEGSTGRQRLSTSTLANLEIMLPPLAEQRAIARVLRAAQDAIAARRREVTLERERKAALMQRLFTHGVRGEPTKQTEIGEIPESWQVVRLGEIAGIERGKFSHRPRNDPEFYGGNVPFIQTGDVTAANGRIFTYTQILNEQGLAVSRVFPKGTIVITIAANIGYTGILEFDSAFPDSLIGITAGVGVEVRYLHYYLVTQQPEMDRRAPQGTQKNINIEFLSPWPVRSPP
jgi:type I restriction enzyme S subunit